MTPTRIRTLATIGGFCAAVTWLLLVHLYASLPSLPWTPSLTLLLLAIVEGRAGYLLQARIRGQRTVSQDLDGGPRRRPKPLNPIGIARTAATAKASAQAAAVIAGIAAGFVLDLAHLLGEPTPRSDTFSALGILAGALILAAAALYLERSCRVPPDPTEGENWPG
jgi:hypothetical protein